MEGSGVADAVGRVATAIPGAFSAFGIELEYMIVDQATLDVQPIADLVLRRLNGEGGPVVNEVARGAVGWSNELVLHLLELKNPAPATDLAGLARRFQRELRTMMPPLAEFGARLMPGGMHPWMDPRTETELWPHDGQAVYNAYDRIFDCRRHGWSNVQAMHVNLPFADDVEFRRLHAAVRTLLPLVPAVAASSPFADGRATGWLDYRMEVYRTNSSRVPELTGLVVPDSFTGRAEYEAGLLALLYAAIEEHDPDELLRREWLNARGAIARFDRHAIEIRVADVQEHPAADVAIAGLLADAAWLLYRDTASFAAQLALETERLAEVLRSCSRDAEAARIEYGPLLRLFGVDRNASSAGALWEAIAERLERAGAPHVALWRAPLQRILARGTLARRLLAAVGPDPDRAALAAVYVELCDCLDHGRDFEP